VSGTLTTRSSCRRVPNHVDRLSCCLVPSFPCPQLADVCRRLLFASRLDGWQLGRSRVFLRAGQLAQLEVRPGLGPPRLLVHLFMLFHCYLDGQLTVQSERIPLCVLQASAFAVPPDDGPLAVSSRSGAPTPHNKSVACLP
jgi:hypothetical protein